MVWISQLSPDISPRTGASLTSTPTSLFLIGGANHEQGPLSDALYTYSFSSSKWSSSPLPSIPPRYDHASCILDNTLIVFGGCGETGALNDTWKYNIASKEWAKIYDGPCARTIQAMPVVNDTAYIWGGGISGFDAIDDSRMWILNLTTGWTSIPTSGPKPRQGHSIVAIGTDLILFGGMNGSESFNDTWVFDTISSEWREVEVGGERPMARSGHVACLIGEKKIAVYGGLVRDPKARVVGDVYILDTGI
jgi:N-acetylneuraminic acid mutarotase